MIEIHGKYTMASVMLDDIDKVTRKQIETFVNDSSFTEKIVIMPDTHAGKGSVIGFTMPLGKRVIPNVVGVDMGCGMLTSIIGQHIFDKITKEHLESSIRSEVPFGMNIQAYELMGFSDMNWALVRATARDFILGYNQKFGTSYKAPVYGLDWIKDKCEQIGIDPGYMKKSLGTLGGGNHFIEIGYMDYEEKYTITVHSGSRNFGKKLCDYWQKKASASLEGKKEREFKEALQRVKEVLEDKSKLPEIIKKMKDGFDALYPSKNDLNFLEGEDAVNYLFDMIFAQYYASLNRKIIMGKVLQCIGGEAGKQRAKIISQTRGVAKILGKDDLIGYSIETVHNYVDFDDLIIRKGAVKAKKYQPLVIPLNMRDGILICEGKSNYNWNCSAPHGAGRLYSRTEAKRVLDATEAANQMEGIYTTAIPLDEAPGAYKDSAMIKSAIAPTAKILSHVNPVMNLKDKD